MGDFVKDFFSLDGMNVWKLHTAQDYLFVGLYVALGIGALWLALRALARGRTPEGTARRIAKKLCRLGGAGSQVWENVTPVSHRGRCVCPMLWAAREGVYTIQLYHFGLEVTGSASSKQWTLAFNKDVRPTDNPLDSMDEQVVILNRILGRAGLGHVPVEKLIIFADIYGRPRLELRGVDCAVVRQDLKKWHKKRKDLPNVDLGAVKKALEASFQG